MIKKIIHTADIHIRRTKYHDMYIEQFEKFIDKIIKVGAIDVKIVENFALNDEEVDFSKDEGEDTLTILNKYIEDSDFDLNKEIVKNLMKEVYQQACELD